MPANKAPGVKDVAALAGVSVGSVSNVINGRGTVRDDVRERVEAAIYKLGYVPNPTAQALRRGVSPLVGVAVFDLTNPFFMQAAAGMEQRLRQAGCVMSLSSTHADEHTEAELLRALAGQAVRGILLTPADENLEVAHEIVKRGIPVVLFDFPGNTEDMPSISIDDRAGAALAIEHLLNLGHRNIAFFNGPHTVRQARQRSLGVQDAIDAFQAKHPEHQIQLVAHEGEDFTAEAGRMSSRSLLTGAGIDLAASDEAPPTLPADFPTAIFCANDLIAFGVVSVLRDLHLSIPKDVSVVGFDDIAIASEMSVPLTTIRQPMEELGVEAVEMLLASGQDSARISHKKFQPGLVVRASTQPPRQ
ncbi:LacI family DNA-binding transcriptional regulator [Schaalia vaccimaxillae]|uniref:LacI family DNA-binding transcriptional regulator n=1 Tax=Schaalia vaccimaxillae TaxID=183916 RepID=UPI0003B51149|nr:LacI family DNA-binding transcriptional regulator [Schaalia vaccimaxillae]